MDNVDHTKQIIYQRANTYETQSKPSKMYSISITHQYEIWTATADIVTLLSSRNSRRETSLLMRHVRVLILYSLCVCSERGAVEGWGKELWAWVGSQRAQIDDIGRHY